MNQSQIKKDLDNEVPVPMEWREALANIANALTLDAFPENIQKPEQDILEINNQNIKAYPDAIGPLSEKSWDTSITVWQGEYWAVLIDLSDEYGETTDLVLHAKVKENDGEYQFEPGLIYVP